MEGKFKKVVVILGTLLVFGIVTSFLAVRMTEESAFCAKCHVMQPVYESSMNSVHRDNTCNDCHTPQDNYITKVVFKGMAGMWDAYVYFTGQTPQVIELKSRSEPIVQRNCIRCHEDVVAEINTEAKNCFDCHRFIAHGDRREVL